MNAQANAKRKCPKASLSSGENAFALHELETLAARASTLEERLSGQFVPKKTRGNIALAKNRFNAWVESIPGEGPFSMSHMLADRKIDPSKAEPLFGEVVLNCDHSLPEWTSIFNQLIGATGNKELASEKPSSAAKSLSPYEQFFYPLVKKARHMRDVKAKNIWLQNLSCEALSDLDFALLEPIADCCIKATGDASKTQILDTDEGLKSFFYTWPVLARLITTMVVQWQTTTLEFMERLHQDLNTEICSLTEIHAPGKVANIEYGLSEFYNEGKSIYKLTFENNLSIGYKPKDLRIDQAWNSLIQWLDNQGAPRSVGVPKTSVCDGYGWVEWIVDKPCETQAEAEEFFQRSGAALCLIQLLHGNDFHCGNVVASGATPVPLDLETVFQARPKRKMQLRGAEEAFDMASDVVENSVLNTGYLPTWYSAPNGKAARLGGLDIAEVSFAPLDGLTAQTQKSSRKNKLFYNIPSLHGAMLEVNKYEKFLLAGYEAMFAFLVKFGRRIGTFGGPLDAFQNVTFRSILRPTHVYTMLMERALKPQNLKNGVTWSLHLDFLLLSEFTQEEFDATAVFRNYERTCLSTFNVPFFSGSPTSTSLSVGNHCIIKEFFHAPCLDQARSRLQNLNDEMLERDRFMIQQCIGVTMIVEPHNSVSIGERSLIAPSSKETIIETVIALERTINLSALKAGGGATWLGLIPVSADERKLQLSVLPPSLFCGTLGIGLLQAALYKITGDEIYRSRATVTTAIVLERASVIVKMQRMGHSMPLGLGFGLGGIIYALVALASMLKDSRYLSFAQVFAQSITPEKITTSRDFGLMSGVAGAMVGLQAFYHRYPSPEIAYKIRDCGRHLLERSTELAYGSKAWRSQSWAVPLTGLMHGASGIALALSRAGQVFNLPQFNDAAIEGLEYESALLSRFGSWPDLRDVEDLANVSKPPFLLGYANGAAGIGMVRLELETVNKPFASYPEDIEHAVKRLSNQTLLNADDLFSGNLGILFFLVRVARESGRSELEKQAFSQISSILANAQENKSFQWRMGNDGENPSFFNGAAGVGMALLQIAAPGQIPDILSLKHSF